MKKIYPMVVFVKETKDLSKLIVQELMGTLKWFGKIDTTVWKIYKRAFQSKLTIGNCNQEKKSSSELKRVLRHLKEVGKLVEIRVEEEEEVSEWEAYLIV